MQVKVKKCRPNAVIPSAQTQNSAGFDLCACLDSPITILPGEISLIPIGIAVEITQPNFVAFIFARSGLSIKHGINLANGVGVVDADYRGEICVGLFNSSSKSYAVQPNERIAQMVILPVGQIEVFETESLSETTRGVGGFGSTGKV